jgi:hypothetical protein
MLLLSVLTAGCAATPEGDLAQIQDQAYRIGNLSRDRAWATGTGCAPTKQGAVAKARAIATFNLRSLTGPARYAVEFHALGPAQGAGPECWAIEARAVRPGPR